jgi:hypothetical protein
VTVVEYRASKRWREPEARYEATGTRTGCKKGHRLGGPECYIVHSSRSLSCGAGRCDRDGV